MAWQMCNAVMDFDRWVPLKLYCRCRYRGRGYKLSTWRTSSGAEVDAILETPDEVIPVEVKWTDRPSPHDARHVEAFLDRHDDLSRQGYVICPCPRRQQLTDRVVALGAEEF